MFIFIVTILACALWLTRRPVTALEIASGVREDTDPHRAEPGDDNGALHPTIRRWRGGRAREPETDPDCTEPFRGA
jgi:hypothetical protein